MVSLSGAITRFNSIIKSSTLCITVMEMKLWKSFDMKVVSEKAVSPRVSGLEKIGLY